jgi:hypothetical protein
MKGKQILYHALQLSGLTRYYRNITLTDDDIYKLEFYHSRPSDDTLICQLVRGLCFDQVRELYQCLK